MKKNAFTLIELLAVIVILAIIALIAVPIVLNIINDSKKSSDKQSVELYIDTVEKAISRKQLSSPNFNPDKCIIQSNGNLKCYKNNELIPGEIEVDMKGILPSSGIVEIKNNKLKFKNILLNGKKYYVASLIEDIGKKGLSIGDKYTYEVMFDMEKPYTFYVLSIEENVVNLIMDRNICGYTDSSNIKNGIPTDNDNICTREWYGGPNDNTHGPIRVMKSLYNATKEWNNVPDMDLSGKKAYEDEGRIYAEKNNYQNVYGYGKIETTELGIKITDKNGIEITENDNQSPIILYEEGKPLKARLPKQSEIIEAGCKTSSFDLGSCPVWLVDNLKESDYYPELDYPQKGNITGIYTYWILSSHPSNSDHAYRVRFNGILDSALTSFSSNGGIRPVITVPREYLE